MTGNRGIDAAGRFFLDCLTAAGVRLIEPDLEGDGAIRSLGHNVLGVCDIPRLASDRTLVVSPTFVPFRDPGTLPGPDQFRIGVLVETGQPGIAFHPLLSGSLAIDAGDTNFCPPLDQRGRARTGICDIGAIEFQASDSALAPDLLVTSLSSPPSATPKGGAFLVNDFVKNQTQTGTAGASTTQFYLSLNNVKDSVDVLLAGSRAVPSLGPGGVSSGTTTVTVPSSTPAGTYFIVTCADDLAVVAENNKANNCRPSGSLMIVR